MEICVECKINTTLTPVSIATKTLPLDFVKRMHDSFSLDEALKGQDVSIYFTLHASNVLPSADIKRTGPVKELEKEITPELGKLKTKTALGEVTLDDFLSDGKSRIQGVMVIHQGKIVYEKYPGMQQNDNHLWASVTKTMASLIVGQLVDEGKIDEQKTVDYYIPEFVNSSFSGIKIIDILDMRAGLDLEETYATQKDPNSGNRRVFEADFGIPTKSGQPEKLVNILQTAKKLHEPGTTVAYSSGVTQVLVYLAEYVENKTWPDLVQERVWSKIGAQGDAYVLLSPYGDALGHGLFFSRLGDLGRYAIQYTPSWNIVSEDRIVSEKYLDRIQNGGRPDESGSDLTKRMTSYFGEAPLYNSQQWDAVFSDGDMFKGGTLGQGIYVSPSRDVVVVYFSAGGEEGMKSFARTIAKSF